MVLVRFGKIYEEYPLWNFKTSPHSLYRIPQLVVDTHIFFLHAWSFRIVDVCHMHTYIYMNSKTKNITRTCTATTCKEPQFLYPNSPFVKAGSPSARPQCGNLWRWSRLRPNLPTFNLNTKNTSLSVQFVFTLSVWSKQTSKLIWYSNSKQNATKSKLKKAKRVQHEMDFQSFPSFLLLIPKLRLGNDPEASLLWPHFSRLEGHLPS